MINSFLSIFPIIAVVLVGFILGRMMKTSDRELNSHYLLLNNFIYYIAAPSFFFSALAKVNSTELINLPYFLALLASQFLMMCLALIITGNFFKEPFGERMLHSLSASFPNILFMGFPILTTIFGEQGIIPTIQAVLIQEMVILPLLLSALHFDLAVRRGFSHGTRKTTIDEIIGAFGRLVKNPLVIASLAGVLFALLHLPVPNVFNLLFDMTGQTLNGVALFAMGVFMAQKQFSYKLSISQESWWVSILKTIVMPLLTWLLTSIFFPYLDSVHVAAVVIISALPTSGNIMLLAQAFGIRKKRSALEYHLSTLSGALTLSIILAYYLN